MVQKDSIIIFINNYNDITRETLLKIYSNCTNNIILLQHHIFDKKFGFGSVFRNNTN